MGYNVGNEFEFSVKMEKVMFFVSDSQASGPRALGIPRGLHWPIERSMGCRHHPPISITKKQTQLLWGEI